MSASRCEAGAGLIVSSEILSGQSIVEILDVEPSKIIVKGAPAGQPGFPEQPFHIAMFSSRLSADEDLEKHLTAILDICERRKEALFALMQECQVTVHCTYLVDKEGGWTITPDLCRRMAALSLEYVFAVQPAPATDVRS